MIIWLAEYQPKRFPRKARIGINEHDIVVFQDAMLSGALSVWVLLSKRTLDDVWLKSNSSLNRIAVSVCRICERVATEHEVTEALDEFLQRDIDLPYVRMEPEEIFAALPEWTRINTLDWTPEGVRG